jgi:hypothetical protein
LWLRSKNGLVFQPFSVKTNPDKALTDRRLWKVTLEKARSPPETLPGRKKKLALPAIGPISWLATKAAAARIPFMLTQEPTMRKITRYLAVLGVLASATTAVLEAQEKRLSDDQVAGWVAKRVKDWQPTADERRFDDIGWVDSIGEALRLGKKHNRPVFLFTHDGRIAIGRC